MDTLHELTLTTLTYGGEAMGRLPDKRAVFVPFGLPGEHVRVRLTEEKRGFARGELIEILEPSPARIAPRCKHFGVCGGCHYQHLSYEAQLKAKADILRDQLTRIGKLDNPPVLPTVGSPSPWNYRNHVQFHLSGDGKLGFVPARGEGVIPISECHLPEAPLNDLWLQLEFEPGAEVERVSLRAGDELMLLLESDSPEAPELEVEAGISVVHLYEEHPVVMAGEAALRMRVQERDFQVSAASFFQVNTAMAEKMVEHVLSKLPAELDTVLDLYCGVGLFSAFLAPRCKRLIGVESSESACEDFAVNLDEFEGVELYEGAAEDLIPHLEAQPALVLVDPPRAGLERQALDSILKMNPPTLLYVSCDPSTLARDAARLVAGGYRLVEVTPFDLFPQTYHIESISLFQRTG
ncbi:MAG: class I SAM-dependent RNA methyltransferase [Chloroflexota bacterium]